jgi:RimJ/RimL family protein N-acetyltransferase
MQMTGFAFRQLGLRRIFATPDADNGRVLRVFEKCGFVREGLLRQHRLRHGVPTDMVMMGLLREDRT